jgi:hypothetical protein
MNLEDAMKKAMLFVIAVSALVMGSVMTAAAAPAPLRVNIPFAFNVGDVSLPAGTYVVVMGDTNGMSSHVILRTADGSDAYFIHISPSTRIKSEAFGLSFSCYGDTYFLSKVIDGGVEASILKSGAEKRLAATTARTLIATLRAK